VIEVERHIRGKWVCRSCERLIQAAVQPHIIDKGIPTAGRLSQVLIEGLARDPRLRRLLRLQGAVRARRDRSRGCMAHARRKLHDVYANHRGDIAQEGLRSFAALYEIERKVREW
jgi:transposase